MQFNQITLIAVTGFFLLLFGIFTIIAIDPWTDPNDKAYWNLVEYCKSCESATAKASFDFNNNQLTRIHFGLQEGSGSIREAEFLKNRFNINTIFGACGPVAKERCYNQKMSALIANRFGIDTLNKTIREARKLAEFQDSIDSQNFLKKN